MLLCSLDIPVLTVLGYRLQTWLALHLFIQNECHLSENVKFLITKKLSELKYGEEPLDAKVMGTIQIYNGNLLRFCNALLAYSHPQAWWHPGTGNVFFFSITRLK